MGLSNMRDDKKIQGYLIFWPLKKLVVDETWLACVDGIESFSNLSISAATFVLARLPRHSCLSSDVTESNTHSAETAIMSFILVVGSQGSGKRALIQALIRSLEPEKVENPAPETQEEALDQARKPVDASPVVADVPPERQVLIEQAAASFDAYPVAINTKYYNAKVTLWRQAQEGMSILALRSVELEGLEGIIIVFDLGQASSLEEAEQWSSFVEQREECAFRLCVGSKRNEMLFNIRARTNAQSAGEVGASRVPLDACKKVDMLSEEGESDNAGFGDAPLPFAGVKDSDGKGESADIAATAAKDLQERRRRCLEWCLDHGFEYVEADCRDIEKGGELREKEGVPRIVEALQSNVWSGIEFCTSSRPSSIAAAGNSYRNTSGGGFGDGGDGIGSVSGFGEGGNFGGGARNAANGAGDEQDDGDDNSDEEEVSEYLTGFVDADGDDAGYGALDSGSEEEQVDAADHGTRKRTLDADADFKTHSAGSGLRKEGDTDDGLRDSTGDRRAFERTAEGVEGTCVILDPEHTELQARWEMAGGEGTSAAGDVKDAARPESGVPSRVLSHDDGVANTDESTRPILAESSDHRPMPQPALGTKAPLLQEDGHKNAELKETVRDTEVVPATSKAGTAAASGGDALSPTHEAARELEGAKALAGGNNKAPIAGGRGSTSDEKFLGDFGAMVGALGGDAEADEMEQLMSEVRRARESGGSVSDKERRLRAADVAMRLSALLGEGEDGDSSSEND